MTMTSKLNKYSLALCAGLMTSLFTSTVRAEEDEFIAPTIAKTPAVAAAPFQVHDSMSEDFGIYARGLYLAYIKTSNDAINRQTQRGLINLATESYKRTSVEPSGIAGIDIEHDDISLFPFIYWPVSEQTPPLSAEARAKLQGYIGRGNLIVIDLINGATLSSSVALQGLLNDLQIRPREKVTEGHVLTQSFYIMDSLPGTANRDVLVERSPERMRETDMTSFVIGNQNLTAAWSGLTVGPDVAENGRRAGLNMLYAALMGNYKLDEIHIPTITQKREFQDQNEERERQRASEPTLPPQPSLPPMP